MAALRVKILFLLLISPFISKAQTPNQIDVLDHRTFGYKDGLRIGLTQSMTFDSQGWLWLSGLESEVDGNLFVDQRVKLQRFNGVSFHTIDLPPGFEQSFRSLEIVERTDGKFYLFTTSFEGSSLLFLFDPLSFEFRKIKTKDHDDTLNILSVLPQNDSEYFLISSNDSTHINRLVDSTNFQTFFSLPNHKAATGFDLLIPFEDHLILSRRSQGIAAYDRKGTLLKLFKPSDFDVLKSTEPIRMVKPFQANGIWYSELSVGKYLYRYEPDLMRWSKTKLKKEFQGQSEFTGGKLIKNTMYNPNGDAARIDIRDSSFYLKTILASNNFKEQVTKLNLNKVLALASKNLNRELFVAESGRLNHFTFKPSTVQTYLRGLGVRGILHLRDSEYLVATEDNGFFTIDIDKMTEKRFPLKLDGKPFLAPTNRGLYHFNGEFWAGGGSYLFSFDTTSHEINLWIDELRVFAVTEDYIYYGSNADAFELVKLSKNPWKREALSADGEFAGVDVKEWNGAIFFITDKGLVRYDPNGGLELIETGIDGKDLLIMAGHPTLGLLITTRLGEIYTLNKENEVSLIFKDEAASAIASILYTDPDYLWLATFSGLVGYDIKTKSTIRFGKEDGLSHDEFNRYSATVAEDSTLLIGTVSGLNHIDPKNLVQIESSGKLSIVSMTYYKDKDQTRTVELRPAILDELKQIKLPAEHRSLRIEAANKGFRKDLRETIRYRLNGNEWTVLNATNVIELANLPSGESILEIESIDIYGNPIGEPIRLQIIAKEFFYKTTGFFLILVLFLIGISYYLIRQANKARNLQQNFSQSLIQAQEQERTRISRDLHDGVGQQLILLKNSANASENKQIADIASSTLEEVRAITRDLHPSVLDNLGLTTALEEMVKKLDEHTDIFFSTALDNVDSRLTKTMALNVYRIVQELLNNVVKHSEAISAKLFIKQTHHQIRIVVQDNGQGFSSDEQKTKSLGLKTLQERAAMLKGKINISSSSGGTKITLLIPINT